MLTYWYPRGVNPRTAILAGLGSGAAVALAVVIALIAFLPDPGVASVSPGPSGSAPPAASGDATPGASPAAGSPDASSDAALFHVGEPAPPLRVPQLGGGEIDLANLRGSAVWLDFTATWCPSCRADFGFMNDFASRYAEAGLVVVAIDVREDEVTVTAFVNSTNPVFPVGLDADGAAMAAWGAAVLPTHFWIDASGIIRFGALGELGPDVMAEGVAAILPGVDVTP